MLRLDRARRRVNLGSARRVVGDQTDCALPLGLPVKGNSGEGFTVLVAAVIRLSQKTSRAFELASAGFGLREGTFFL